MVVTLRSLHSILQKYEKLSSGNRTSNSVSSLLLQVLHLKYVLSSALGMSLHVLGGDHVLVQLPLSFWSLLDYPFL